MGSPNMPPQDFVQSRFLLVARMAFLVPHDSELFQQIFMLLKHILMLRLHNEILDHRRRAVVYPPRLRVHDLEQARRDTPQARPVIPFVA